MNDISRDRKVYFVLTVDTEEEFNWYAEFPRQDFSLLNIRNIPKFQKFCNERGVKPTYFVDYSVISDIKSIRILKETLITSVSEIGAHMHPWCTPPFEEEMNMESTHIINLPRDLVRSKIRNLTNKIEAEFGRRPIAFRSGRWGMNGETLKLLSEEGYQIDSSVFPYYEEPYFSYEKTPDTPYWPSLGQICEKDSQRKILEMPVSVSFNYRNRGFCNKIHRISNKRIFESFHILGILRRLHLFQKMLLCPELADASEMISCIKACARKGQSVIHMFLHSSSLLIGGCPFIRSEADEEALYRNMGKVFQYMKENMDVCFCTLTEARDMVLQEES